MSSERHLWAVVLAGGAGTRFWPASTPAMPKQLLPLASARPLIRDTVDRVLPLVPQERLRILTGEHLAEPILSALPEFGPGNLLLEPRAAGTAPVLAWAAAELERRDPDAIMISLHSDHVIQPGSAFRARLALAAEMARRHRRLFTIGAVPTRPETGFGYIRAGAPLVGDGDDAGSDADSGLPGAEQARSVAAFVEKPDEETARRYLAEGGYLWNTGLFVWRATDLLDQLETHTPELAPLIPLLREGGVDEFFRRTPSLTIDEGLLERSDRVAVLPSDFEWDDVGSWDAVLRTRERDAGGNAVVGDGHVIESADNVVYTDAGPVVAFGVNDLVIVRTAGVTFVTTRERVPDLKRMVATLPDRLREL